MKKNILCFVLFFSFLAHADEWSDRWQEGLDFFKQKKLDESIACYSASIQADPTHAEVWLDRAKSLMWKNDCKAALRDLDIVEHKLETTPTELIRLYHQAFTCYGRLDMEEEAIKCLEIIKKIDPSYPKASTIGDKMYLRNVPSCKCVQKSVQDALIGMGFCDSEKDIQKYEGMWIIKKKKCQKKNCVTPCEQSCGVVRSDSGATLGNEECYRWCNRVANSCAILCTSWFPSVTCCVACQILVEAYREVCTYCCDGGDFYKKCVQPFESIKDYVKCPKDPAWDD